MPSVDEDLLTPDAEHAARGASPYLFVVGCPRSGTTLLQRILDHHPELAVANDTHFITRCLKATHPETIADAAAGKPPPMTGTLAEAVKTYHRFSRLGIDDAAVDAAAARCATYREFVAALYAEHAAMNGKRLAGEKTPNYVSQLPLLHGLFPGARFVHIIRDGRDVALSMLQWARPKQGPRRFDLWYQEPVAVCALWWRSLVMAARQDAAKMRTNNYCEVRYEQLVTEPVDATQAICDFLDLPYDEQMLSFFAGKTNASLRDRSAKSAWLPPTPGLRDWRSQLHAREVELFDALAGDLLHSTEYERIAGEVSAEVEEVAADCRDWWEANVDRRARRSKDRPRSPVPIHSARRPSAIHQEHLSLAPEDAELARRDPGLPGLSLLLDEQALTQVVAQANWYVAVESARCTYLRYKPGAGCVAVCEFQTPEGTLDGFAIAHRAGQQEHLEKFLYQHTPSRGGAVAAMLLDERALLVAPPAYDPALRSLNNLFSARGRSSLLRRVFAEQPDWHSAKMQRLRYKPQRRYVAQMLSGGAPRAVLKLYREADFPAVKRIAKTLCSGEVESVVPLIGRSDRHCALAFDWLAAPPLHDCLAQPGADAAIMQQVGAALARLHAHPAEKLPRRDRQDQMAIVRDAATTLHWLCPQLAREIDDCQDQLLAQLERSRETLMTLHGDFHASQVLCGELGVQFIDLDRAARGHPAADVGSFLAHVDRACLIGEWGEDRRKEIAEHLVAGYYEAAGAEVASALTSELPLYRAASLFRLAAEAFRLRHRQWPLRIEEILRLLARQIRQR